MGSNYRSSLATRFLQLLFQAHEKGVYIKSLKEAAAHDNGFGIALGAADAGEIRRIEKNIGEAEVDMFYDAADAAVVGLELSGKMKHSIFLQYLERNMRTEALFRSGCAGVTHAPKA